jgi:septum formation protein
MIANKLILASSSPYRKILLEKLRLPFDVYAPHLDETPLEGESVIQTVYRLAESKAKAANALYPEVICIAADTAAEFNGQIINKPETHTAAVTQLQMLQGKKIIFHTGLSVSQFFSNQKEIKAITEVVSTQVTFRALNLSQIENYLRIQKPYGCAASLKCEDFGPVIMEKFEGEDYTALIGLPLIRLSRVLEAFGVNLI